MLVRNGFLARALICSAFAWSTLAWSAEAPSAKASPYAFDNLVPNIPGKRMVGVVVDYPPGAKHTAHHHPASAFITGNVLSGAVRTQVDDGPIQTYRTGDSFIERPGAHHRVSENASATQSARVLAIFLLDDGDKPTSIPDE